MANNRHSKRRARRLDGITGFVSVICALIIGLGGIYLLYNVTQDKIEQDRSEALRRLYNIESTYPPEQYNSIETAQPTEAPTDAAVESTDVPSAYVVDDMINTNAEYNEITEIDYVESNSVEQTQVTTYAPLITAAPATNVPTDAPVYIEVRSQVTQWPAAKPIPTDIPTAAPTIEPEISATSEPTVIPTAQPSEVPTEIPTAEPTPIPTVVPGAIFEFLSQENGQVSVTTVEPAATEEPDAKVFNDAFLPLYELNDDVVGWIKTGYGVDYPIMWRDNSYYLTHDFDHEESKVGAIFLDARNSGYMDDDALLIYGHNMKSGAMFGDLDEYRKLKNIVAEPFISIQSAWEADERKYVYFSLFDASMNFDDPTFIKITNFNFDTPEEKSAYIEALIERSFFELPVDVTADDQLVLLITCSYSQDNGRFLLFGRELHEDETEDQFIDSFTALINADS